MKKTIVIFIIFALGANFAQDSLNYKLNEVIITSTHRPSSVFDVNKNIEIIKSEKIETIPVGSIQDMLTYSNSIELNQRGTNGVQADIGIRGGNFEQTLILLDGIKIIDPQTGHHNLNLPITSLNVDQIEIVKGNSSNINGANAFSGLVNFKTKRNKFNSLVLQAVGGDFGLYTGSLFGSYNIGKLSNNLSIEKNHSNGYRENTEYDITNFSYGASYAASQSIFDVFVGYTDKSFGANSFYTTTFPLQYEETKTTFAKLSAEFGGKDLNYSAKVYWRKNDDEFLLDKTNPVFYKNNHTTNIYGSEIDLYLKSYLGSTSIGGELVFDAIESSNLGKHDRKRAGVFIEQKFPKYKNLNFAISGFLYNYSMIGWKLWPGIDLGYSLSDNFKLFANFSRGFRIPTYTELFYSSPTTVGNQYLTFEETSNYEVGSKFYNNIYSTSVTLFYKTGKNIIDWIQVTGEAPWQAMNIAELNTGGIEFSFDMNLVRFLSNQPINSIGFKYTYLNSDYSQPKFASRYFLKYFRHQAILSINHNIVFNIKANWYFRFEERFNSERNFITDLRLDKNFGNLNLFVKGTNLFNVDYYDFIGVPLPGRWIAGGLKYNFSE